MFPQHPAMTQVSRRRANPLATKIVQHAVRRLALQLSVAAVLLGLCGAVYMAIEPRTPTLADGLWLAFTTAATVGYGDVVPTTAAAKLFSIVVVLIGFAVLSLVTASIAAIWVESSERAIEQELLHDLHARMHALSGEIAALRGELSIGLQRQQAVEDQ
jgi:voltage-gated potassium channel